MIPGSCECVNERVDIEFRLQKPADALSATIVAGNECAGAAVVEFIFGRCTIVIATEVVASASAVVDFSGLSF